MGHLNVEFKARCARPDEIVQRLVDLGAQHHGRDVQIDVYYQAAKGRLKLRRGELENNVIHYDRTDGPGPKESHVSLVPLGAERVLDDLLDAALDRDIVVTKRRDIFWLDNVKFHLDSVTDLGSFVEVEAIDYDGDRGSDALRAQCQEYMTFLGIRDEELEDRSYSDMLRTRQ